MDDMVWTWVDVEPYEVAQVNGKGKTYRVVREGKRRDGSVKILITDKRLSLSAEHFEKKGAGAGE